MSNELSPWVPAALGLAVGVFVWAVLCAIARRKKQKERSPSGKPSYTREGCEKCPKCRGVKRNGCVGFPKHGHSWCGCGGGWVQ